MSAIECHPSGLFFEFDDPRPEQVDVRDIACALSKMCRYVGQCAWFYSVAEHSLLTRRLVIEAYHPELALAALLHDGHEAYLHDISSKLKPYFGDAYAKLVRDADWAIGCALGVSFVNFNHPVVKAADALALRIESRELKRSEGLGDHWGQHMPLEGYEDYIHCWDPLTAEVYFRAAFAAGTP